MSHINLLLICHKNLDLRSSDKLNALQNLHLFYTWKNIRKQYKNNKLKIIAPTWNDEFQLQDASYSVSAIQDYIEFIIIKHKTLRTIPSIYVYISRINSRLVINIKDGYKLELQTPETMKLAAQKK